MEFRRVLVRSFEDWMYATKSRALLGELSRDLPARRPGPVSAQALPSGPDSSSESIPRMQVSANHAARERVWLMTPYFVPPEPALVSLISARPGGLSRKRAGQDKMGVRRLSY